MRLRPDSVARPAEERRPVKVALVTETFPPEINGVAMTLGRLTSALAREGDAIEVVRPRQSLSDRPRVEDGVVHVPVAGRRMPRYPDLRLGWPAFWSLRTRWNSDRPDVVHVSTEGPLGVSAVLAARSMRIPLLTSFHTNFDQYARHYGLPFLRWPTLLYLRSVHNRAARTLVPDPGLIEDLRGVGFRSLEYLGRGVDTDLFRPDRRDAALRQQWGAGPSDPVFLHVSRVAAEKNFDTVIHAFRAVQQREPGARLVVVGDGPIRRRLQRAHPDFVFAGYRQGEDLARHYASADVLVFASLTETFGNVTLEAMASGLPVVAFAYAAAGRFIRSQESGFTVPAGDPDDFRRAVFQALDQRAQWQAIGKKARAVAATMPWRQTFLTYRRWLRTVAGSADEWDPELSEFDREPELAREPVAQPRPPKRRPGHR